MEKELKKLEVIFTHSMPLDKYYKTLDAILDSHAERREIIQESKPCSLYSAHEIITEKGESLLIPNSPEYSNLKLLLK